MKIPDVCCSLNVMLSLMGTQLPIGNDQDESNTQQERE